MSYKVLLWDALSPIRWSQAQWHREVATSTVAPCEDELACDVILSRLPQGALVVDAGCGTGKWASLLRRHGWHCIGIEISPEACQLALGMDAGLPLIRADTRFAPVRTGSVDVVLSLGVVEHDEDGPDAGVRELRRILRRDGLLFLAVPFDNWWRRLVANPLLTWITARRQRQQHRLGFVEYRFTLREVHALLRRSGFEPLDAHPNDYRPPRVMGLWVDLANLTNNPLVPTEDAPFVITGWRGKVARALLRHTPWLVCGEVLVVARAT